MRLEAPFLGLALALLCAGCAAAPLRVGSDLDHAPFIDVDAAGRPCGTEVELMERLGERLDRPVEWVKMPFAELFGALERGEVEVLCATLGITEERAQRFAFTTPTYVTDLRVLVRRGAGEPQALADLVGRRVAASRGTTSEDALRERLRYSTAVLDDEAQLGPVERLRSRAVDGVVMDGPDALTHAAAHADELAVIEEAVAEERYALMVRRDSDALLAALNRALAAE